MNQQNEEHEAAKSVKDRKPALALDHRGSGKAVEGLMVVPSGAVEREIGVRG
jgi:hypothetical protein